MKKLLLFSAAFLITVASGAQNQIFTSTGTFTVPPGVTSIVVECWGAGGGGSNRSGAAGAGGGGAFTRGTITGLIPGNTITVTVGTGGAAGSGGGASSVSTISANGGSSVSNSRTGGAGGGASPIGGNVVASYSGGNGGNARATTSGANNEGGGGGGGSATTTANGGNGGSATSATGGAGGTGTGAGGRGGDGNGNPDAAAGNTPGGGGGGRGEGGGTSKAGANGQVIISWTQPVFYSQNSGNPGTLSNWNTNPGGGGYSPTSFTVNYQTFTIQSGHNMATTGTWSVSGTNTIVRISSSASLTANNAVTFSAATTFQIDNGGTYNHNHNINNNIFSGTNTLGATSMVNYMLTGIQTVAGINFGNLTLSGSGVKTLSGGTVNGVLSLEGTITTTGTTPAFGVNATLRYQGSASQSTGVEWSAAFSGSGGVVINNTAGVILTGNATVSSGLTMNQGNITTGSYTLILSNSSASSLTRISGTVIGRLRRAISTTAGADYLFPVGTADNYRPATMNFSSLGSAVNITAEFVESPPFGFTSYTDGAITLNSIFTDGYWRFVSSGTPAASYSLSLTADGFDSFQINANTRITGRDNTNSSWRGLGTHGTISGTVITRTGVSNLNTTFFEFGLASECSTAAMSYGFERDITIDYTRVEGGSDLYNFPMLVSYSGESFLRSSPLGPIMSSNGYDIIFTDSNHNKLDHQIEYYNGTNGDLIAWVRIPILSSSSNTVVTILYGNSQITTDQSVTTVWDSHYKGVWHLNDNNLEDVTEYDFSGTPYNTPTYSTGTIYNSLQMNGTNEYVQVNNNPNINFAGNITVSAWVNMDTRDRDQKIAGNQNNSSGGYKFGIYTNNMVEFEIRNSANTPSLNRDVTGGTVLATGQWYYLAGISSDVLDSIKTFVNGVPERPFKKTGILGIASDNLSIGKEPFLSDYYFDGRFDELRISDKVRSNGWLRTEYNSQASPSTFYTTGAEVSLTDLPSAGICNIPITLPAGYPAGGVYSGNPYISGNIFTPPSAGTYSIVYTYNGACGPASIAKNIVITPVPPAPAAPDRGYCINQITYLEAVGENVRWYSGGTLVSTANPFSTGQTTAGTFNYTVTQTVNGCESSHEPVVLTIYGAAAISVQPLPETICEGENAVFTVTATGNNLAYQWLENGAILSEGGVYSGVSTPTLTLTSPTIAMSGRTYRCIITTSCGSPATSNTALLTVTPLPVASFTYTGTPYCPNATNPLPTFSVGGVAGAFSSSAGLVFANTATGEINIAASTPGSYIVTNTIAPSGGCGEVVATSSFAINTEISWTGTVSSDWNNTGNWSCGLIPNITSNVRITDVTNDPVLSSGGGAVNNIIIDNGATLTITGNTIRISGTITNNGTFTATGGTVEMNGSVLQQIGAGVFNANTIGGLIINNPAGVTMLGALDITGAVVLSDGILSSDGNLTLISSASQTAYIDGSGSGTVSGDITMQRYLPVKFGYKYFSSPFQDATVGEFGDDMDLASAFPLFYRNEENSRGSGWISYADSDSVLYPLEGYAVNFGAGAAPHTVDVTGVVNNGPLSVTLYNHDSTYTKGFNLVGNPYPSPIDWNAAGWTKTAIDNAVYYFRASETDEYGGEYSSYAAGESSDGVASNIIPSMQGFFVHVSDGAFPVTGVLGVTNNVRVNDLTHPFLKSAHTSTRFLVRATASFTGDQASADPMVVYFDAAAEAGFDSEYDALKLMNTDMMITNFYSVLSGGKKLSINALPLQADTATVVPLGLKTYIDGELNFRIKDIENLPVGAKLYFRDRVTGININLLPDQTYKVTLKAGDYNDRFSLAFLKGTTGITDPDASVSIFEVYATNSVLKATVNEVEGRRGIITVFDLSGRPLYIAEVSEAGYYELETGIRQGIYIVSYITGSKNDNTKLLIGY